MTTTALRSCLANDLCALALFFKPVDTSNNTGFHHRYHCPDSFSVILCASASLRETCSTPIAESARIPE
ncbi:MAG: hypothetical protein [Olavius algarvensis Gamma 1 endosymbiont]|nr:MAG: hypothetical protein [Olavius algarvensis Gamma 1 endosymbiont]